MQLSPAPHRDGSRSKALRPPRQFRCRTIHPSMATARAANDQTRPRRRTRQATGPLASETHGRGWNEFATQEGTDAGRANDRTTAHGILDSSDRQFRRWTMARVSNWEMLKAAVTVACLWSSALALPLALVGVLGLMGGLAYTSSQDAIAGLQLLGVAAAVWMASVVLIASCEGSIRHWRFSMLSLIAVLTMAALVSGAIATWILHLQRAEVTPAALLPTQTAR